MFVITLFSLPSRRRILISVAAAVTIISACDAPDRVRELPPRPPAASESTALHYLIKDSCEQYPAVLFGLGDTALEVPCDIQSKFYKLSLRNYDYPNFSDLNERMTIPLTSLSTGGNKSDALKFKFNYDFPLGLTGVRIKRGSGKDSTIGSKCPISERSTDLCTVFWQIPEANLHVSMQVYITADRIHKSKITPDKWPYTFYPEDKWPDLQERVNSFILALVVETDAP